MNKELSIILRDKLIGLPFVDVLAGIAQTLTTEQISEDGSKKTIQRQPVSYDVLGVECEGKEISLVPDSSRKSMIYFEDFGILTGPRSHGVISYVSSLRLICWMNRAKLVGEDYKHVAAACMASIIDTLTGKNPENNGIFKRLTISLTRIQPQDARLFGAYTYSEPDRQFLRPPFEFFGIDLTVKYQVPAKCISGINWNLEKCT
jgi:hypothetical protein